MVEIYDVYLSIVLALLLLGVVLSRHPAVELHHGLGAASLVGGIVILDMLFRNPPIKAPAKSGASIGLVVMGASLTLYSL